MQIFRTANITRADGLAVIGKPDVGLMCLHSLAIYLDRLQYRGGEIVFLKKHEDVITNEGWISVQRPKHVVVYENEYPHTNGSVVEQVGPVE